MLELSLILIQPVCILLPQEMLLQQQMSAYNSTEEMAISTNIYAADYGEMQNCMTLEEEQKKSDSGLWVVSLKKYLNELN
jgi:hypothetical protein